MRQDYKPRLSIFKEFADIFGAPLPDYNFSTMWNSMSDEQILDAMHKAKLWLDHHAGKTTLDAAKITSSLLRDVRTNERRRKQMYD